MQTEKIENLWALIDHNWGDPRIVISTIKPTEQEAKEASVRDHLLGVWSGYSPHPLPMGRLGTIASLEKHGFQVKPIAAIFSVETADG